MRDKSDFLLRDEYGRLFVLVRIAEMLVSDRLGGGGPCEIRIEHGVPEWDDLAELWFDGTSRSVHRWQVKRQSSSIACSAFEKMIQAMILDPLGEKFIAHLALRDLVAVDELGDLRVLRELCNDRIHGIPLENIDVDELTRNLSQPELSWVKKLDIAIASDVHMSPPPVLKLLSRLHIEVINEASDLKDDALKLLRLLFADGVAAFQSLHEYLSAYPHGHVRLTPQLLFDGPLKNCAFRRIGLDGRSFELDQHIAGLTKLMGGIGRRIETGLLFQDQTISFDEVCQRIQGGQGLLVIGPSGAGKTILLRALAQALGQLGAVPIYAEAKSYDDHLRRWLDESIEPLNEGAFGALIAAANTAGRRVVVLIDGLEEAKDKVRRLLDEFQKSLHGNRYTIIVAARERPAVLDSVILDLRVDSPDAPTKQKIFAQYAAGAATDPSHLLGGLNTPLEIELAAQAIENLPESPLKFQLVDAYVRRILRERGGEDAIAPVVNLLVLVSEWMTNSLRSTIGMPKLRSLGLKRVTYADPVVIALRAGLLIERAGYASFRHELFRQFFDAEALLMNEIGAIEKLTNSLKRPRYRELGELILGALLEPADAEIFIHNCTDHAVLVRSLDGRVGSVAQRVATRMAEELIVKVELQWRHLPIPEHPAKVEDWWALVPPLSSSERALMGAAAGMLAHGRFWNLLIPAVSTLDRWWQVITQVDGNTVVKSLYIYNGGCPIVNAAGWMVEAKKVELEAAILPILMMPKKLSPGVNLIIAKLAPWHSPAIQSHLPRWFDECWQSGLWHVQCEATEVVRRVARNLPEGIKVEMVPRLQKIWDEARVIFGPTEDALATLIDLGEVQDPSFDYEYAANGEIEDALAPFETAAACREAYFVFQRQFEEFIGDGYCKAIMSLNDDQQVILLCRAAKGALDCSVADGPHGEVLLSSPCTILKELIERPDIRALDSFSCWAQLPLKPTLMDNEGANAFVYANAGLGRLGHPNYNIGIRPDFTQDRIWYDIGTMIRHLHVPNLELTASFFKEIWANLQREEPWLVLEALRRTLDACIDTYSSCQLVEPSCQFPEQVRQVVLKALHGGIPERERKRVCRGPHLDPISYAFYVLERVGTESDAKILDKFVDDADWGLEAIEAIIAIRNREIGGIENAKR